MAPFAEARLVHDKGFAAATSVLAAIFLTAIKLTIGTLTGSLGILAEAAHSGLDLLAALVTLLAVRVSDRPADETHLYGHGKVENLSALSETALLLVTCAWIIYEAISRLISAAVEIDPSAWAFLTMGVSIVVDFSRSRVLAQAAKKYKSQALEADALHFSTDIWSSAVVILGLALVKFGEWIGQKPLFMRADALSALVVAFIVVSVSLQLGRRAIDALLDTAPAGLAERIADAAGRVEGVRRVLKTRVRGSGNQVFVDLTLSVPRHMTLEESDAVTDQVQQAVQVVSPSADVVVHADPTDENEGILEKVSTIAVRGHFAVHNITTHLTKSGLWVDLDLEVDPAATFESAHASATALEGRLRAGLKHAQEPALARIADINVHIEPRAPELARGSELKAGDHARYADQIVAISKQISHVRDCKDIDVQWLDGSVYLALHLLIDSDQSVEAVHLISEEMEDRLRTRFPRLGRVVIHAEPFKTRQARS